MRYFNAIAKLPNGSRAIFHEVSNPNSLINAIKWNYLPSIVWFYELPSRKAKTGIYCGYWTLKKGMQNKTN